MHLLMLLTLIAKINGGMSTHYIFYNSLAAWRMTIMNVLLLTPRDRVPPVMSLCIITSKLVGILKSGKVVDIQCVLHCMVQNIKQCTNSCQCLYTFDRFQR